MNKKAFLKALEDALKAVDVKDTPNILEYYDELIEDQKENGKKEKDIVAKINIDEIIKGVKVHKKINDAVKKPTLSNGLKALIAFLGVLSIPMLITVGSVLFAIIITIMAVLFALTVTSGAVVFAGGASFIAVLVALIIGKIPFSLALFLLGTLLVLGGVSSIILKWIIELSKEMVITISQWLNDQLNKRKGGETNE